MRSSARPGSLPTLRALAIGTLAGTLASVVSGCSVFVILAREARGTGDDGTLSLGVPVSGDTNGGTNAVTPGCGSRDGTPERRYFFTAPTSGRYVASTDSQYDAVLAIYPHGATGEPIVCNDDDGSTARSRAAFDAEAGTTYDVVVDGYNGSSGGFTLVVQPETATSGGGGGTGGSSLEVGLDVTGSTATATDTRMLSCGAPTAGTPDVSHGFTPTTTGTYTFRTQTDYDGTLEVFEGSTSLGCNDDDGSTRASRVDAVLQAGHSYTIVLDGFGSARGNYHLMVTAAGGGGGGGGGGGTAVGGTLTLGTPVSGSTVSATDTVTLPCGAAQPGTPDATYTFTPSEDGQYVFRTQTDYDGTLAVFENGTVLGCNDDDGSTRASRVGVALVAGRTYQVVVDGFNGGRGSFQLQVDHPIARPAGPITAGQTVQGSTVGGADTRTPPCGSMPGTPEQIWTFTAPVTATYRLHVDSDYDGVLAVYPVGATDPLLCNDDAGSTRASEIEGSLMAGQRYEVVVDGYGGGQGNYTLRLDLLSGIGGTPVTAPSAIPPSIRGGPLPENLTEMDARCGAAQPLASGRYSAVLEPTEGAAQLSCGSGGAGGDVVYALHLPTASEVFFHVAADFEVGLEVRRQCTADVERCVAAPARTGTDVSMTLPAGDYFVVLDAMESTSRGPVYLDVNVRPSAGAPAATGGGAGAPSWPPWGW
jgi:hypothetical protein